MSSNEIRIMAEPLTATSCRFTVSQPVYPKASYFVDSKEKARGSPLATRLFEVEGVVSVLIAHDQVTVNSSGAKDWREIGPKIGAAIRQHLATGQDAVDEALRAALPPPDEIHQRVQRVLDEDVNPSVASHGGFVRLLAVRSNDVYLEMGGGCQGCGMAKMTLKYGVETAIRRAVPEVGSIFDTTDHAAGRTPYATSSGA
jgi:Fe-S cluster biogenesis protein NfuA